MWRGLDVLMCTARMDGPKSHPPTSLYDVAFGSERLLPRSSSNGPHHYSPLELDQRSKSDSYGFTSLKRRTLTVSALLLCACIHRWYAGSEQGGMVPILRGVQHFSTIWLTQMLARKSQALCKAAYVGKHEYDPVSSNPIWRN